MATLITNFKECFYLIKINLKKINLVEYKSKRKMIALGILIIFLQVTAIGITPNFHQTNAISTLSLNKMSSLTTNQLVYGLGTYYGGSSIDTVTDLVTDSYGNVYILGSTYSSDLPTRNAYNSTYGGYGNPDIFIAKFNETGVLIFSTYFGGSYFDQGNALAVDKQQNIYIVGLTESPNFPIKNAYQPAFKSSAVAGFFAKFNPQGSLIFSTFVGGSGSDNEVAGITVDNYGNSYLVGTTNSTNFLMKNAWNSTYGGGYDSFLAKYDTNGNLIYSTYIGGSSNDFLNSVAVDNNQNVFTCGHSTSANYPVINPLHGMAGLDNAVYSKFNSTGDLVFSTFYGGSSADSANKISVDSNGNVVMTGSTSSTDFPVKNDFQGTNKGVQNAFVVKFFPNNTVSFSTYLGGGASDYGLAVAFDPSNNIYIGGYTESTDFNVTSDAFQMTKAGGFVDCGFFTEFNQNGVLMYSTFFGGSTNTRMNGLAIDSNGNLFLGLSTYALNMPLKNAYYSSSSGNEDAFIAGFYSSLGPIVENSVSSSTLSTATGLNSQTNLSSSSSSIGIQDLINNPVFLVLGGIATLSVIINLILLIKRRK